MIQETIKKIETKIRGAGSISSESKTEMLTLLATLESEITELSELEAEHAESITGFIERSTHEATRQKKDPELLTLSLAGLVASVRSFEASHPSLVADINYISNVLAKMGI